MTDSKLSLALICIALSFIGTLNGHGQSNADATVPKASNGPLGNDADFRPQEEEWLHFRNALPLHVQTIAISSRYQNGSRTLVVSEPPPHVTVSGLKAVDPALLSNCRVKQWTIGYDGWVKDVVFKLPDLSKTALNVLIKKLSRYLFNTDYKAHAFPMPLDRDELDIKYPLDVKVRTRDLESWYEKEQFLSNEDSIPKSISQCGYGVHLSKSDQGGLVAWIIPKNNLEKQRANARRFALDSDLILGAVATEDRVVIFGRERVAPLATLPPMRTEMIMTLAATKDPSLGQSYERDRFGAGPSHAGWDWAPIFLSPELLDTEYGSILNMTDQMLKAWTLADQVEYYNFPILAPGRLPFDEPLVKKFDDAGSLLFNWNTSGFGISGDYGKCSIYAVTRTGALPVIYRPDLGDVNQAVRQAEEDAYAYYASLSEPLLARAVQYVTLYQIFTIFEVSAEPPEKLPKWDASGVVERAAQDLLRMLREASEEDLERITTEFVEHQIHPHPDADEPVDEKELKEQILEALKKLRSEYVNLYTEDEEVDINAAKFLAGTQEWDEENFLSSLKASFVASAIKKLHVPLRLYGVLKLQKEFSQSKVGSANPWIHTPTVVWSRTLGEMAAGIGGHNLDTAVTHVGRSTTIEQGEVRVELVSQPFEPKVWKVTSNPKDAPIIEKNARLISSAQDADGLKRQLKIELQKPDDAPLPRNYQLADLTGHGGGRGDSKQHLPSQGGSPPPPKLPPRPGTTPPSDPPPPRGNYFGPESKEILVIHKDGDNVSVRRDIYRKRDGGDHRTIGEVVWHRAHLVYAIGKELEPTGRPIDQRVLKISFDSTFSVKEVRDIMGDLALHGTKARKDRLVVAHGKINQFLPQKKKGVYVKKVGENKWKGEGNHHVDIATKDKVPLIYEVILETREPVTSQALRRSVSASASKVDVKENLPEAIYAGILKDMKASREGSRGTLRVGDIGDFHVVEFEHEEDSLGMIAWRVQPHQGCKL